MNESELLKYCKIGQSALNINKDFFDFWHEIQIEEIKSSSEETKKKAVSIAKKLILKRIEVVNSFELLIRLSRKDALEILDSKYLGDVCPYKKFGGFQNELSLMLDDYLEIMGFETFKKDILLRYVSSNKLKDSQVISAFCEALDLENKDDFVKLLDELLSLKSS